MQAPLAVGYPIMAALFVLAATLFVGVTPTSAAVLMVLTGGSVWSNTKLLAGSRYLHAYAAVLSVKLALLLYQVVFRNLPLSGLDWKNYHRGATMLGALADGEVWKIVTNGDWDLFTRLTASWYSVFGSEPEQIYFLVFISSLVAFRYIFLAVSVLLEDELAARRVAMLFLLWPNEVILSVTYLREMPIQMLVAASLYHFLRYWRNGQFAHLAIALASAVAATLMHSGLIALLVAYSYLAIRNRNVKGLQPFRTALFVFALVAFLNMSMTAPLLSKFGDLSDPAELLDLGGDNYAVDATTYYLNPGLGEAPLVQIPYRFLMFALSPLPWQATTPGTAMAVLLDGFPRLIMVYFLLTCYRRCRSGQGARDSLLLGLLGMVVATYVIFSFGVSTYGTAMRHRAKLFPVEIILVYLSATSMASLARARGSLYGWRGWHAVKSNSFTNPYRCAKSTSPPPKSSSARQFPLPAR